MGIMTEETAELLVQHALREAGPQGDVNFAFQGGEPTLAGKSYFRTFVETVRRFNTAGVSVTYSIQTNGLAIDAEWASFFAQQHFLVGVSVDGDKAVHDEFRVDVAGKGTWTRVQKSIKLLQQAGVDCNLLCVVTRRLAKNGVHCYHALQKTGVCFLQFIPCLDPLGEARGQRRWSLTPKDYGNFLCALFDEWHRDWKTGRYTSVRLFDDYVHLTMGWPAGSCAATGSCGSYLVVEADGSVYPCDFFALDAWKLGSIQEKSFAGLRESALTRRFIQEGYQKPTDCGECPWKRLCNGGCKRDWTSLGSDAKNYYCPAYRQFFSYAFPRIREIAIAELSAGNAR